MGHIGGWMQAEDITDSVNCRPEGITVVAMSEGKRHHSNKLVNPMVEFQHNRQSHLEPRKDTEELQGDR